MLALLQKKASSKELTEVKFNLQGKIWCLKGYCSVDEVKPGRLSKGR